MASIVVVYHSGYGHTKAQAERVAKGAQGVAGASVRLMTSEEAIKDLAALNSAGAIIFGCPTYMGSLSAKFKEFMEATSKIWGQLLWKDKLAAGFTNSGSPAGDKFNTLVDLAAFAAQHGMIWVNLGINPGGGAGDTESINRLGSFLGATSQSPHGSAVPLESDLKTSEALGRRVAELALRLAGK